MSRKPLWAAGGKPACGTWKCTVSRGKYTSPIPAMAFDRYGIDVSPKSETAPWYTLSHLNDTPAESEYNGRRRIASGIIRVAIRWYVSACRRRIRAAQRSCISKRRLMAASRANGKLPARRRRLRCACWRLPAARSAPVQHGSRSAATARASH